MILQLTDEEGRTVFLNLRAMSHAVMMTGVGMLVTMRDRSKFVLDPENSTVLENALKTCHAQTQALIEQAESEW
jgi:hypothetical protein